MAGNGRPDGGWQTHRIERVYANPWIEVDEHQVTTPGGSPGIYGVVRMRKLAVGVVPIDAAGGTVLVGQYRYPHGEFSWEIPEGGSDPEAAPQEGAARELAEETGLRAGRWHELLRLHTSNSVTNESAVIFLAWDLQPGPADPDDTEDLTIRPMPLVEAVEMALAGEITDAISLAALFKIDAMWCRRSLPSDLLDILGDR